MYKSSDSQNLNSLLAAVEILEGDNARSGDDKSDHTGCADDQQRRSSGHSDTIHHPNGEPGTNLMCPRWDFLLPTSVTDTFDASKNDQQAAVHPPASVPDSAAEATDATKKDQLAAAKPPVPVLDSAAAERMRERMHKLDRRAQGKAQKDAQLPASVRRHNSSSDIDSDAAPPQGAHAGEGMPVGSTARMHAAVHIGPGSRTAAVQQGHHHMAARPFKSVAAAPPSDSTQLRTLQPVRQMHSGALETHSGATQQLPVKRKAPGPDDWRMMQGAAQRQQQILRQHPAQRAQLHTGAQRRYYMPQSAHASRQPMRPGSCGGLYADGRYTGSHHGGQQLSTHSHKHGGMHHAGLTRDSYNRQQQPSHSTSAFGYAHSRHQHGGYGGGNGGQPAEWDDMPSRPLHRIRVHAPGSAPQHTVLNTPREQSLHRADSAHGAGPAVQLASGNNGADSDAMQDWSPPPPNVADAPREHAGQRMGAACTAPFASHATDANSDAMEEDWSPPPPDTTLPPPVDSRPISADSTSSAARADIMRPQGPSNDSVYHMAPVATAQRQGSVVSQPLSASMQPVTNNAQPLSHTNQPVSDAGGGAVTGAPDDVRTHLCCLHRWQFGTLTLCSLTAS